MDDLTLRDADYQPPPDQPGVLGGGYRLLRVREPHRKSFMQRLFTGLMPWWADDMEKESREWMMVCPSCDHERSYWEVGGIRWKAKSRGKYIGSTCPACGKTRMHKVIHRPSTPGEPSRSGD